MCHFQSQNGTFVLKIFFLVQTIIITFIYLLALFIVPNLQQILMADLKLWGCSIFGSKMIHLFQTIFFRTLISFLSNYQPLSWCKISKRSFQCIQRYHVQFLGIQWPICPNEIFFLENLLMNLVPFIHAYLHAKNQSQILIYCWNTDD